MQNGDEDSVALTTRRNVSVEARLQKSEKRRRNTVRQICATLTDGNSTIMKWIFRFQLVWVVVAIIINFVQLFIIFSYWKMGICKHLEEFNQQTTNISSTQGGYNEHEFELKSLKKIDESLDRIFWLICFLYFLSFGILASVIFQFLLYRRNKIQLVRLLLIVSILLFTIALVSETSFGWQFIAALGEKSEAQEEVSRLFTSAADKNPAGFKEIERIFSCSGYTMKNKLIKAKTKTCTQHIQEAIMKMANWPIIVVTIIFIFFNIIYFLAISVAVVYFVCLNNRRVDPPRDRSASQGREPPFSNGHLKDAKEPLLEETTSHATAKRTLGKPVDDRIGDCENKRLVEVELHHVNGNGAGINHDQEEINH